MITGWSKPSNIAEPDGDYHIRLLLDSQFAGLINARNVSGEHGDLVLEPVCEHGVTQRDAIAARAGVAPSVPLPAVGIHALATGAYVLDQAHGWMELHPLWDIHACLRETKRPGRGLMRGWTRRRPAAVKSSSERQRFPDPATTHYT